MSAPTPEEQVEEFAATICAEAPYDERYLGDGEEIWVRSNETEEIHVTYHGTNYETGVVGFFNLRLLEGQVLHIDGRNVLIYTGPEQ